MNFYFADLKKWMGTQTSGRLTLHSQPPESSPACTPPLESRGYRFHDWIKEGFASLRTLVKCSPLKAMAIVNSYGLQMDSPEVF